VRKVGCPGLLTSSINKPLQLQHHNFQIFDNIIFPILVVSILMIPCDPVLLGTDRLCPTHAYKPRHMLTLALAVTFETIFLVIVFVDSIFSNNDSKQVRTDSLFLDAHNNFNPVQDRTIDQLENLSKDAKTAVKLPSAYFNLQNFI